MTYRGHIKNGAVVFDESIELPEGAEVMIAFGDPAKETHIKDDSDTSLYERLHSIFGIANDLPKDGSLNLDQYLYGSPKA